MSSVDEREPASGGCSLETSVLRKRWTSSAYISSGCHFVSANWDESCECCWVTTAMWLRQCKVYGPDNEEYRRNYIVMVVNTFGSLGDGFHHLLALCWSTLNVTWRSYFHSNLELRLKAMNILVGLHSVLVFSVSSINWQLWNRKILSSCIWGKRRGRQRGNSLFSKNCLRLIHWDR